MDRFIETTPFFAADHRTLAERVADLAEREVEVRAGDDEQDVDEAVRGYVMLLFEADLLRYAVAVPGEPFDLRSFCLIRETLSYSSSLADLEAKVGDCFLAGAVATGCDYSVEQTEPMYDALKPDPWLAETVRAEMTRLGRSPIEHALETALPLGSTDMGNVTQLLPGIHPMVAVDAGGASLHQPDFTAAAAGPSADKAVVEGAES